MVAPVPIEIFVEYQLISGAIRLALLPMHNKAFDLKFIGIFNCNAPPTSEKSQSQLAL